MNEFFFWFVRPIAELLGSLVLLVGFFAVSFVVFAIVEWRASRRASR